MEKTIDRYYIRGRKLQNILADNNITQTELAEIINFNKGELSKVIHGKRTISANKINEICSLFNINKNVIINETKSNKINTKNENAFLKGTYISEYKWNNDYFKQQASKKNILIRDIAVNIGIDKTNFSNYNRAKCAPSVETIYKICQLLECDPKLLIGYSEDELNDMLIKNSKAPLFNKNGDSANKDFDSSCSVNSEDAGNTKHDKESVFVPSKNNKIEDSMGLKSFSDDNVIDNINIINENIIAFADIFNSKTKNYDATLENMTNILKDIVESNRLLSTEVKTLKEKINRLESVQLKSNEIIPQTTQIVDNVENEVIDTENAINTGASVKTETSKSEVVNKATTVIPGNNHCTEKEMKSIIKGNVQRDTLEVYKTKIYKLTYYISRKTNLIFNQVMHDNYNQFARKYGFDYGKLKKETNTKTALDAIYENLMCRTIFFNMVCQTASNC